MFAGGEMIKIGVSSTTPEPGPEASQQPKERIPLMAIPATLAVGLLVAGVYVGNRVFASRGHATPIVVVKPEPVSDPVAKPTAFGPLPSGTQASKVVARQPSPASPVTTPASQGSTVPHAATVPIFNSSAPKAEVQSSPVVVTAENQEARSSETAGGNDSGLIAPQHGERYLQIAAISSHMVPSFLADLKKYSVQASVAPGPHDGLVRIVIGPFSDRDSIARAKDQIQTKWPDCFVRLY
jgi:cell division septation protein DedD